MAILEAMAARLPILLTAGCNFPQAAQSGAAVQVLPEARDTERGLRQLLEMSDGERHAMGNRGRQLVEKGYSWDVVAGEMMKIYQWLSGGGSRPDVVQDA
jgi:poly(glycerol-phosphate) alpha-glucosyltransferase